MSNPFLERDGETHRIYLGDGVYASFDGYQIWLRTLEGNSIALEPSVYHALIDYAERLREEAIAADLAATPEQGDGR